MALKAKALFESRAGLGLATLGVVMCCAAAIRLDAQESHSMVMRQQPTGWFGVRINDQMMLDSRGNAFFDSYPVVTAVDSGSPAARAGVKPGDVLMTFNAHDMRGGAVELAKWLKVGAPFVLKIRRNDATRVVKGTLGRRPENWDQRMTMVVTSPDWQPRSGSMGARVPSPPMTPMNDGIMRIRQKMPAPEALTALAPVLGYSAVYPFAGAEFTALNTDLCDLLDVKPEGVFVTNVLEGSLARTSGLRGGDIIVKANGNKVITPIDLVQAIKSADDADRNIVLVVMRKHRLQTLALSW
ncbi:MAG TPA: PDZ domain-containing protein [Gemmatimonadaceae bacterium]